MESPLTPHPIGATLLPRLPGAVPVLLEFEDVQLGGYAWWRDRQAPAILLLHGWGEDASTMAPVAHQVLERGRHAVSISLRGWHGSTGVDDYGLSASLDISRVLAWIRRQPDVAGIVLVGFSMGGLMAALAAADQPAGALDGVVLVNAPAELRSFARDTAFGGARRYLEKTLQPRQWQDSSPLNHADRLSHPLLVVVGTEDTMTPPDQGRRLADAAPASALFEVAGMGHHPTHGEWAQILEAADTQFDLGRVAKGWSLGHV
ncbi:alpha/beta fold hydrolase [Micrococcus luteus]|nr:alpha/beta fold hydrolase [Micrococcus luteus]